MRTRRRSRRKADEAPEAKGGRSAREAPPVDDRGAAADTRLTSLQDPVEGVTYLSHHQDGCDEFLLSVRSPRTYSPRARDQVRTAVESCGFAKGESVSFAIE